MNDATDSTPSRVVVVVGEATAAGIVRALLASRTRVIFAPELSALALPPPRVDHDELVEFCAPPRGLFARGGIVTVTASHEAVPEPTETYRWPDAPHRGPRVPQPCAERVRGVERRRHVAAPVVRRTPLPRRSPRRWRSKWCSRREGR